MNFIEVNAFYFLARVYIE